MCVWFFFNFQGNIVWINFGKVHRVLKIKGVMDE